MLAVKKLKLVVKEIGKCLFSRQQVWKAAPAYLSIEEIDYDIEM